MMYSVVVLMALSGSAEPASFGWGCKGCTGCTGCTGSTSCHGGKGCCGGGFKLFGGKGCCGGCHGCTGGCVGTSCHGGKGCCGGGFKLFGGKGCCGGCHGCTGGCVGGKVHVPHASVTMPQADAVVQNAAPATIVVNLPAEAKLTIDGNSTSSSSERRVFVSPALEAGQEYYYTIKAEINGQVKEERVTVKAGAEVSLKLDFAAASVASK